MWPLTRTPKTADVDEAAARAPTVAPPPAPPVLPVSPPPPEPLPPPVPAASAEEALRRVVEGTSADTGRDFFRSLVRHLAAALGMRWAFVGELLPPGDAPAPFAHLQRPPANGEHAPAAVTGDGNGNGHSPAGSPASGDVLVRVLAFWDERQADFSPNFDY